MSHECSFCGKVYQRNTHLRRHEATHSGSNQFTCPYCRKNFSRRDVCRKHATSCTSRGSGDQGGATELRTVKRGQRTRACDACSQSKLACDQGRPCIRCVARQVECTYVKALEDPSNSHTLDPLKPQQRSEEDERLSIPFLLELTDPTADSMIGPLLKEPPGQDEGGDPMVEDDLFSFEMPDEPMFPGFFPWNFAQMMAQESHLGQHHLDLSEQSSTSEETSSILEKHMSYLISELKNTHEKISSDPFYDGTFDEDVAKAVFTPHNARAFISANYRDTHRSFPVTHKPSFDYETALPELLLGLMINGSARLVPQDDALAAASLYRLCEFYIFRRLQDATAEMGNVRVNGLPPKELTDILAAALEIHGITTATKKSRMRNILNPQRPQLLVSTVRYLGLTSVRHPKPLRETSWEEFVATETCIRMASWTAFASWQEASFSNAPPQMSVAEMRCDLPCAPELWDANDEDEFRRILAEPDYVVSPSASIKDCMDSLLHEKWAGVAQFPRTPTNLLEMLMVIFAIHASIASARLMAVLPIMAPPLLRAISRWFEVWDATIGRITPEKVQVCGLSRHSASLAWLARGTIQLSLRPGVQSTYLQNIGMASIEEVHELVQVCSGR